MIQEIRSRSHTFRMGMPILDFEEQDRVEAFFDPFDKREYVLRRFHERNALACMFEQALRSVSRDLELGTLRVHDDHCVVVTYAHYAIVPKREYTKRVGLLTFYVWPDTKAIELANGTGDCYDYHRRTMRQACDELADESLEEFRIWVRDNDFMQDRYTTRTYH